MKRLLQWFNFLTFLFVISLIAIALFWDITLILILSGIYIIIYTFSVMILGFVKAEKTSYKVFMVIGCIVLPGIMPFIYYVTYLKGVLKREILVNDIKAKTLAEIQNASQQNVHQN